MSFNRNAGYSYIWEFQVRPEAQQEFELHYGNEGTWVQLFRQAAGYIETLLLKDSFTAGHYLTIDRWRSEDDYLRFRRDFSQQYEQLDQQCARLTADEKYLGQFIG